MNNLPKWDESKQKLLIYNILTNTTFRSPKNGHIGAQMFERFRVASEVNLKPEEMQVNMLLYCMGAETDGIKSLMNIWVCKPI